MSLQSNAPKYILISIVFSALFLRLALSFTTDGFSDDSSYHSIRQAEHILATGKPLYYDPLSYGGRDLVVQPAFYYLLAGAGFIMPLGIAAKLIPNILLVLVAIIVYYLALQLTRHVKSSLIAATASVFLPIVLEKTVTTANTISLALPLLLLTTYFFITTDAKSDWSILRYMIVLALLCITSGIVFIYIIGLGIYYLITSIESISIKPIRKELILFSVFFAIWSQFLIYKKAFLTHGVAVIWQNLPTELIGNQFSQINVLIILYALGIIPFIIGVYAAYMYAIQRKDDEAHVLLSIIIAVIMLLLTRLLPITTGLIIISCILVIIFGAGYKKIFFQYLSKTKIARYKNILAAVILIIFIITSIVPSLIGIISSRNQQTSLIQSMSWIEKNTPINSTILGTTSEGTIITALGHRKNVIDTNFLLSNNPEQRLQDIKQIYTSPIGLTALALVEKYEIDYILVDNAKKTYNINTLRYAKDDECYELVYNQSTIIYRVRCQVQKNE